MELSVKPAGIDISYQFNFKEPMLGVIKEDRKIALIQKFLQVFELSVDQLKWSLERQSSEYIQFSKFYGPAWFNVRYGFEKVDTLIQGAQDEQQVLKLFGSLYRIFEDEPIAVQRVSIRMQLLTKSDVNEFLRSLNPYCPEKFKDLLKGRGVSYALSIPKHNLNIGFAITNSIIYENGIYLSIENEFNPNLYKFDETYKIVKEYADFVWDELKLKIDKEGGV